MLAEKEHTVYTIPDQVRAISFDIWKTLLIGNPAFTWPRLQLVFGYVGILDRFTADEIVAAYRRAEAFHNAEAERTGWDTGMKERIEFVLNDLGVTDKPVPTAGEIIRLQEQSGVLRVQPEFLPALTEPDLVETLIGLRAEGYRLGLLSNTGMGDSYMMMPMLRHYGLHELMHTIIFSCDDGRAKPNPSLFKRMARELEHEPGEVLHVGDNPNADCRATEAGLHAVLYAPSGEPEGNTHPFITSMKELLR